MFKKIQTIVLSLIMAISFTAVSVPATVNGAADISKSTCDGIRLATSGSPDTDGNGTVSTTEQTAYDAIPCKDTGNSSFSTIITNVINILSILVGAVSVIMLIVGGFRYIISNGDSNSTKGAKDTIMYALIGLIIVLFAQVIVRFVWTNASGSTTTSTVEVDN